MTSTIRPEVAAIVAALCRVGACSIPEIREVIRAVAAGPMDIPQQERVMIRVTVREGVTAAVLAGDSRS